MKIAQLEPFVKAKGFIPKHLILSKGAKVKWLICLQDFLEGFYKLVVYDNEGWAYVSDLEDNIDEEFFDKINVRRNNDEDAVSVNGIICKFYFKYNYYPEWRGHENNVPHAS